MRKQAHTHIYTYSDLHIDTHTHTLSDNISELLWFYAEWRSLGEWNCSWMPLKRFVRPFKAFTQMLFIYTAPLCMVLCVWWTYMCLERDKPLERAQAMHLAAQLWNQLPDDIRGVPTLPRLKCRPKTQPFSDAFLWTVQMHSIYLLFQLFYLLFLFSFSIFYYSNKILFKMHFESIIS